MKWTQEMDRAVTDLYATRTREEIAVSMGLTEGQVRSRFYTLGMATKIRQWTAQEIDELRSAYSAATLKKDIGLDALAQRFGRDKANVSRKARSLGLTDQKRLSVAVRKVRDPKFSSEADRSAAHSLAHKAWIKKYGHPRGALGLKHTAETKSVISKKGRERWGRMSVAERDEHMMKMIVAKRAAGVPFANPRGTWRSGWREIGGRRTFFRSRWEANYALYLQWLKDRGEIVEWQHESKTFWFEGIKRGCVSYLPDFKVDNPDGSSEWHEVKGWMDARSATVLKRMAKYHPAEKIVVVKEKQYMEIERKLGKVILGWEFRGPKLPRRQIEMERVTP